MEITYTPEVCKEHKNDDGETRPPTFEGTVTIRAPSIYEKYEYMEKCGLQLDENGVGQVSSGNTLHNLKTAIQLSEGHYVAVDLTRLSDDKHFTSFEEMKYEPDCESILIDVGMKVMTGKIATPGND